jgi:DNA polymerase III delta prime subunit
MTEIEQLKHQILTNKVKIKALRAYGDVFQKSLHKLAESLADQGYSEEEIVEALHATIPTLKAGIAQVQADIDQNMGELFADA